MSCMFIYTATIHFSVKPHAVPLPPVSVYNYKNNIDDKNCVHGLKVWVNYGSETLHNNSSANPMATMEQCQVGSRSFQKKGVSL